MDCIKDMADRDKIILQALEMLMAATVSVPLETRPLE